MNNAEPICVVFATDENYVQHLCVTLLSLLYNRSRDVPLHVFVLGDNLSFESTGIIRQIAEEHNVSITFPDINFDRFGDLVATRHQSRATYARFAIPETVHAHKALYLDCDLIIRRDILEIWKIDISDYYVGAVVDGMNVKQELYEILRMPFGEPYFNAGVLMINLKKWRQDGICEKLIKFTNENANIIKYQDQDALNAILWGRWFPFHLRWNVQKQVFRLCYNYQSRRSLPKEFIEAVRDPAIVHYTTNDKPWHYKCKTPYVEEYYRYLAMTPWKDYRPPRTIPEVIEKNIKMFRRRLTGAILGYRV